MWHLPPLRQASGLLAAVPTQRHVHSGSDVGVGVEARVGEETHPPGQGADQSTEVGGLSGFGDYRADAARRAGRWHGQGAERLIPSGLVDRIDPSCSNACSWAATQCQASGASERTDRLSEPSTSSPQPRRATCCRLGGRCRGGCGCVVHPTGRRPTAKAMTAFLQPTLWATTHLKRQPAAATVRIGRVSQLTVLGSNQQHTLPKPTCHLTVQRSLHLVFT